MIRAKIHIHDDCIVVHSMKYNFVIYTDGAD